MTYEEPNTTEDDMNALYAYEQAWGPEPEGDDYAEEERYYLKPRSVKCVYCGKEAVLTHRELDQQNWLLDKTGEYCPVDAISEVMWRAAVSVGHAQAVIERIEREDIALGIPAPKLLTQGDALPF